MLAGPQLGLAGATYTNLGAGSYLYSFLTTCAQYGFTTFLLPIIRCAPLFLVPLVVQLGICLFSAGILNPLRWTRRSYPISHRSSLLSPRRTSRQNRIVVYRISYCNSSYSNPNSSQLRHMLPLLSLYSLSPQPSTISLVQAIHGTIGGSAFVMLAYLGDHRPLHS
jgi:hypothetical protein